MKNYLVLILLFNLCSCADSFDQNTNLETSCFHECSFLINADEPDELNLYNCNGVDLTDQLTVSRPVGVFGNLTICSGPGYHFRALVGIDSYDGEASADFNNWHQVTIRGDCMRIALPAAQFDHVIQIGVELHAIIEITETGTSSELDNVSPAQMQELVPQYRDNLCP